MPQRAFRRRLPVGAEPGEGGVHFRVWAPDHANVELVLDDGARSIAMEAQADGYFVAEARGAAAGTNYQFRLTDGVLAPDPASRYQPEGPHGPSRVVDPHAFAWTDDSWTGIRSGRQVIYELHIGTLTPDGTWQAALGQLAELASLGITILEIMPIAEFPGRFNWGYDSAALFAPAHVYGTPDDFRTFVDAAHGHGLAVILDVVYNHMGPDGCYMPHFAHAYFSRRHTTDWGDAINFDGDDAAPVRAFFLANAEYWISEYHLDGLRLDATQSIYDESSPHIVEEIALRARAAAGARSVWIIAENEPQDTTFVRPREVGGYGLDAIWNDDFHHTAIVALTGRREAYYSDYRGTPQELVSAAKWGFLYHGQYYSWQDHRRGAPTYGVPAFAFVNFLENHDQVANSADGKRIHELAGPGECRALTALLLLLPGTAMLFQGQEFHSSAPFLYFADHAPELAHKVHTGRREFLAQFPSAASPEVQQRIPDPAAESTFLRSKLDLNERLLHETALRMHRDLIRLSREDALFARQDATRVHGAVLAEASFVLRYFADDGDDRLVLVNLGRAFHMVSVPEPLLAPPRTKRWAMIWSSEQPAYGGQGTAEPERNGGWSMPAHATIVLAPARRDRDSAPDRSRPEAARPDQRAPDSPASDTT